MTDREQVIRDEIKLYEFTIANKKEDIEYFQKRIEILKKELSKYVPQEVNDGLK